MPAISVNPPFPLFTDADGQPLDDAYIYIGTANQNPVSNPITVYWDSALTIAAAQPIRTSGGYPVYNGTPARFYTASDYSILVRDKNGAFIYTAASETDFISSEFVTFISSGTGAVQRNVQSKLRDIVNVKDFGAVGDDSDETTKLNNALTAAAGNILFFEPNKTYRATNALVVPANTGIELNGSLLKFVTSGAKKNLDLRSGATVRNGTVENAGTAFAGSGDYQCPILIGDYGSGTGYNGIILENLTIKTARPDGNGIMVTGDSFDIDINNISFPDSSTMMIPVLLHWGGANAPTSGTTHPHNINVRNLKIGAMTYAVASDAGQLLVSGCYNVNIENVDIKDAHNAGLYLYSGDYGFYYAPNAIKGLENTGITIKNFSVQTSDKYGCVIRGDAPDAPGSPVYKIPARIDNLSILSAANNGINLQYAQDTQFIGCLVANSQNGIVSDTANCQRIFIKGGTYRNNTDDGIFLKNNAIDCVIDGAHCYANGYAGVETVSTNTRIVNCTFGSATEASQDFGIRVGPSSIGDILENNLCLGATSIAFSLANGTSYGTVACFSNNVGPAAATGTGGLLQVPWAILGAGNTAKKLMYGSAIPASGTWNVGDVVWNTAPTAGGFIGWVCTTAGTPGTWKTFGAISA